nr:hypothetical protein [Tanacetum cinerariifolium]
QREGGEHASASTPSKTATGSAGISTTWSQSGQLSASESAFEEEPVQTTCQIEEPSHPVFETGAEDLPIISELARQTDARSSFNELLDTPIDFSNFIMNRLGVDTLTPELLAGPTYELMRGSCNNLAELEYHLEEVYKATTDQLDWVNPEGQQYPHHLLQPLPLIPDNRGRRVIPFEHFINNDLEYLRGGASSRKYTTSVTKTKATNYGHIKGIEDVVPRFYGFAVNRESALNVYSKRRIIAVTELKIVEWHNYKHLDWISVPRDDDKIYKFKEGDFKRLRLQDIEDMLLLLVQGKLSNLTVEKRFAFNVSLRMFTRSIVIQIRRPVQPARVCSYTDFMKCQPLNFKGTEGVVVLSRWVEKMELVFHISGCAVENQVKFTTCTRLDAALTWWNGHVRTLALDAAYAMTWETFKKKLTDKYCPKELTLMCTKFLFDQTEMVDKYISGLPDNIHGNVMSTRPKTLDFAIELANDLWIRNSALMRKNKLRTRENSITTTRINNNFSRNKMWFKLMG